MSKISIIVPVYNAESSINRTLDSLLSQTYRDLEIICVDDGSSDNSLQLLNQRAKSCSFLHIIHQPNQGVSIARNAGIDIASGNVIMFVDADDVLVPHACERVNQVFESTGAEVFTFGFSCEPAELTPLGMERELTPPCKSYDTFEPTLLFQDKARPYICRTAVSRNLIEREHIRFEPGITLGEDQIIYFLLYPLSKKTILSPEQLWRYQMNHDSATHSNASDPQGVIRKLEQHMKVIETVQREWQRRNLKHICDAPLLEWSLDFTLFDMNGLEPHTRTNYFQRFVAGFERYLEAAPSGCADNIATRLCIRDIEHAIARQTAESKGVNPIHLALFYLRRYGFLRCFQQVLIGMGLLKKWK